MAASLQKPCPCGAPAPSGEPAAYDACCGRLHRGAAQAVTAEELMRSRYSAYAVADTDHLFRTWHPRTRPDDLRLDPATTWTGLRILGGTAGGPEDERGTVEFEAHYETPAGEGVLHEDSRFQRRAGRWVYVDGKVG
ncbi:YchJ family protein [Nocardioides sp. MAHUQ-72]|uniref:YchJ family protein n=1 Tax=unclassified Nocardioides TaxID=2615069 RepID=UPI003610EAEB